MAERGRQAGSRQAAMHSAWRRSSLQPAPPATASRLRPSRQPPACAPATASAPRNICMSSAAGHVLARNKSATTTINSNPHFTSVQLVDRGSVVLGIGGGVGPAAGVGLHQKIIDNTLSKTDQGHFSVVHISRSPHIADRTKFLLGESDVNPGEGMADAVWAIAAAAKTNSEVAIIAVPCNTFHAPPVWQAYVDRLRDLGADGSALRVIHMLDECIKYIAHVAPDAKKIGLMSTTGTRESRVYRDLLEPRGYEVLEVDPEQQADVHETIYNQDWGIKAVSPVTLQAVRAFRGFAGALKQKGADVIILGCTEIPLALPEPEYDGVPLVDPVEAVARAMIAMADPAKLKPPIQPHEQVHFHRISTVTSDVRTLAKVLRVARKWKSRADHILDAVEGTELDQLEQSMNVPDEQMGSATQKGLDVGMVMPFVAGVAVASAIASIMLRTTKR